MTGNIYYILGEIRMSGCLFWEVLKIKEELDSVMVNLNKELCFILEFAVSFYSWTLLLCPGFHVGFVLTNNYIAIVNLNQSIHKVQRRASQINTIMLQLHGD